MVSKKILFFMVIALATLSSHRLAQATCSVTLSNGVVQKLSGTYIKTARKGKQKFIVFRVNMVSSEGTTSTFTKVFKTNLPNRTAIEKRIAKYLIGIACQSGCKNGKRTQNPNKNKNQGVADWGGSNGVRG